VVLVPLIPVAPFFVGTMWYSAANYYVKHRRSHLDVEWAKEHLPWHYDHHMGPNQNANWCVTHPFFDHVMGTREPYLGSERELRSRERRAEKPEVASVAGSGTLSPATV
jgi:sterol desaturase/sphingolipid hydroxylase (fatty acid hydroxylase superfamily)